MEQKVLKVSLKVKGEHTTKEFSIESQPSHMLSLSSRIKEAQVKSYLSFRNFIFTFAKL